ncbi:helix-turn-helix domain-containing protein [Aliifodinibius salicampi]|uniref:Helix-turn-helix domain-containing protein n=1 Tax=Fodinibius salicampi TaxID=1920655 RepID=A0ABT3PUC1_9BACT|nr:helix-turn-helix domain-containing protein [Fodinibius salicampi]MCW9711462.1 helix-turn-helix domain-containing protein [Fodinibius salicampi]
MSNSKKLQDWYKQKIDSVPEKTQMENERFDVFKLDPFLGDNPAPVPYDQRDYYKVMLFRGKGKVLYADKVIEVKKQALSFSNPLIPCEWIDKKDVMGGLFCIFDKEFFQEFADFSEYSVFQPGGNHVFELTDEQLKKVATFYKRMFKELNSDYQHKYDVLRTIIFDLMHFAMKMEPSSHIRSKEINASRRISMMFQDLLERQFPIDDSHRCLNLRMPSDFAEKLNVHVNHLNRALKETTGKTTSQHVNERILQEAKILLKRSQWNISEIGYGLGFSEAPHFSNFFKKHVDMSPSEFRDV